MCESSKRERKIAVTYQMIQAGLSELNNFDPEMDSGSEFVVRLFKAMVMAESATPSPFDDAK